MWIIIVKMIQMGEDYGLDIHENDISFSTRIWYIKLVNKKE